MAVMRQPFKHQAIAAHAAVEPLRYPGNGRRTQAGFLLNLYIGQLRIQHSRHLPSFGDLDNLFVRQEITKKQLGFARRFKLQNGRKQRFQAGIVPLHSKMIA